MLADGRLHLTGLSLLASRLTPENHAELLAEVAGKTKAEILVALARWFPRPDVPDRVEPLPGSGGSNRRHRGGETEQGSLGLDGMRPSVEPRSEGRVAIQSLTKMGFKKAESRKAVAQLATDAAALPMDQLIRRALRLLEPG